MCVRSWKSVEIHPTSCDEINRFEVKDIPQLNKSLAKEIFNSGMLTLCVMCMNILRGFWELLEWINPRVWFLSWISVRPTDKYRREALARMFKRFHWRCCRGERLGSNKKNVDKPRTSHSLICVTEQLFSCKMKRWTSRARYHLSKHRHFPRWRGLYARLPLAFCAAEWGQSVTRFWGEQLNSRLIIVSFCSTETMERTTGTRLMTRQTMRTIMLSGRSARAERATR